MIAYGLGAEYVWSGNEDPKNEKAESESHLALVLKGLAAFIFAVAGILYGWF